MWCIDPNGVGQICITSHWEIRTFPSKECTYINIYIYHIIYINVYIIHTYVSCVTCVFEFAAGGIASWLPPVVWSMSMWWISLVLQVVFIPSKVINRSWIRDKSKRKWFCCSYHFLLLGASSMFKTILIYFYRLDSRDLREYWKGLLPRGTRFQGPKTPSHKLSAWAIP